MKIYRIIADKKPSICRACPLWTMHICGIHRTERGSSSSVYSEWVPDERCRIRIAK